MATGPVRPPSIFVGDHLALDFLNTSATPHGVRTEWLRDGSDLLAWLVQAGVVGRAVADRFGPAPDLDEVAERARNFRGWLDGFVRAHAGEPLDGACVGELGPLNQLLAGADSYLQVVAGPNGPGARRERRWEQPEQLLHPLAEAAADLICSADFRLVRACEGHACTLLFFDRTRSHGRRWCSMAVCGNRAKAAAHRSRRG